MREYLATVSSAINTYITWGDVITQRDNSELQVIWENIVLSHILFTLMRFLCSNRPRSIHNNSPYHTLTHDIIYCICDRLQENWAQRGTLRKNFFLHLQSCRRPDIELSKFYRRSLSCSHYNRPNRSLPSA